MAERVQLEQPNLFKSFWSNFFSWRIKRLLLKRGQEVLQDCDYQPNISVLIRIKNEKTGLSRILDHIKRQQKTYAGRIDVIVVDTQSSDGTTELARKSGATVVNIRQKDFSYPKSINLGMQKAKPDSVAVFVTVGHAQPALNICLKAGARHFKDSNVVGVYASTLANQNATSWERLMVGLGSILTARYSKPAHKIKMPHPGVMGAVGAMYRLETWRRYNFDEAYAHGGEDSAWAKTLLRQKMSIVHDPAMAVHHTHGLGLVKLLIQIKYWMHVYRNPGEFNHQKLAKHRPDLFEK